MASDLVRLEIIQPKEMNIREFDAALLRVVDNEGRVISNLFRKTTESWTAEKPSFIPKLEIGVNQVAVFIGPSGPLKGVKKWGWLTLGTSVRHAVLSGNWRSKTKVRQLSSGGGAGQVIAIRRSFRGRGIEAREYPDEAAKRRRKPFAKNVARALTKQSRLIF